MDTTSTATTTPASLLLKLPAELRLQIYEYALYIDDDGVCEVTRNGGIPEPALLFTCKTVRDEGIAVFYSVNTVCLIAESFHPGVHNLIASKVAAFKTAGVNLKKLDVEICAIGKRNFRNLIAWVQFLHSGKTMNPSLAVPQVAAAMEPEPMFVDSLFRIAEGMRQRPWADVDRVINGLRGGLIALNEEWKEDA